MSTTIGIDFGTSFCSASWINPNTEKPEAVRFKDCGNEKLPSIIAFSNSGKALVGSGPYTQLEDIAIDSSLHEDEREMLLCNFYTSIKTHIRKGQIWRRPDKSYTDADLISFILKKIKDEVIISVPIGSEIDSAVITHPVEFEEWKKEILKNAAALAGFKRVKLLEEPTAAAIYALKAKLIPSTCQGLLVYDFGAGTFDVTYLQIDSNGQPHMPVLPQGDAHCGGDDIDKAIYDDWNKYIKATKNRDVSVNPNELDIAFMYRCRRIKEQLSKGFINDEISEYIPGIGRVRRAFTENDFSRIVEPIVDRTIAKVNVVLDEIKQKQLPLTHAVLIGGSSNLPLVQTKMQSILGKGVKLITTGNYDIAVAVGAMYSVKTVVKPPIQGGQNGQGSQQGGRQVALGSEPKKTEPKECFCIHCGKKIMTSHKICMFCGKPNYSYKE